MLKDRNHVDELTEADRMIHQFVAEVEELYNVKAMTFNVHILLHVCRSVLNWGPLWTNSTFCFESANHYLLNAIKCAKGVTQQIIRHVNINHSLLILEEIVTRRANDGVVQYCNDILLTKVQNVTITNGLLYFWSFEGDNELLHSLHLSRQSTEFYYKMVKDHCLYESYFKLKKRSNNSFAQLHDGKFIRIIGFIVCAEDDVEMTICNYIHTKNCYVIAFKAFQEIQKIDTENAVVPTKNIDRICIYMKIDKMYICPLPNLYHY